MTVSSFCPYCGASAPPGFAYCRGCGKALPTGPSQPQATNAAPAVADPRQVARYMGRLEAKKEEAQESRRMERLGIGVGSLLLFFGVIDYFVISPSVGGLSSWLWLVAFVFGIILFAVGVFAGHVYTREVRDLRKGNF